MEDILIICWTWSSFNWITLFTKVASLTACSDNDQYVYVVGVSVQCALVYFDISGVYFKFSYLIQKTRGTWIIKVTLCQITSQQFHSISIKIFWFSGQKFNPGAHFSITLKVISSPETVSSKTAPRYLILDLKLILVSYEHWQGDANIATN